MTTGSELVNTKTGEITTARADRAPMPLMISPEYVAQTQKSLALLQHLTKTVLVKERDYGHVPGIAGEFLWDPGAQMIISAFNCHVGQRRILSLVDDSEKIAVVVEVPLVNYQSGLEVGSGVGAASTMEARNHWLWIEKHEFEDYGITEETAATLKKRTRNDTQQYRIERPERGELLNTLIKIASKRAEVDAAESLPGVSSALRELFDWKAKQAGKAGAGAAAAGQAGQAGAAQKPPAQNNDGWTTFWSKTKQMGLSPDQVHQMLGVKSAKEWVDAGKTLDQAIDTIAKALAANLKNPNDNQTGDQPEHTDPATIKTFKDLYKATKKDFGLSESETIKETGYSSQADITATPAQVYQMIKTSRG